MLRFTYGVFTTLFCRCADFNLGTYLLLKVAGTRSKQLSGSYCNAPGRMLAQLCMMGWRLLGAELEWKNEHINSIRVRVRKHRSEYDCGTEVLRRLGFYSLYQRTEVLLFWSQVPSCLASSPGTSSNCEGMVVGCTALHVVLQAWTVRGRLRSTFSIKGLSK